MRLACAPVVAKFSAVLDVARSGFSPTSVAGRTIVVCRIDSRHCCRCQVGISPNPALVPSTLWARTFRLILDPESSVLISTYRAGCRRGSGRPLAPASS